MSNQPGPNNIGSAYDDFLQAFRMAAEDADCQVSLPALPIRASFTRSGDGESAIFETCFYLKKLPCRRLPKSKRLDVVIKARETLAKPAWTLTKSTVYLNYFVISDATVKLVQAMHYDFEHGGQADHPYFHLQLDNKMIPVDDLRNAGFNPDETNLLQDLDECWVTTRIPTADMTLPSVLYSLAADHLGTGIFADFERKTRSIHDRLPVLDFDLLKKSLGSSSAHFKSSHWFAHMFQGQNLGL
jgi:hypothetical protein